MPNGTRRYSDEVNARINLATELAIWLFFVGASVGGFAYWRTSESIQFEVLAIVLSIPAIAALVLALIVIFVPGLSGEDPKLNAPLALISPILFAASIILIITLLKNTGSSLQQPPKPVISALLWLDPKAWLATAIIGIVALTLLSRGNKLGPPA